MTQPSPPNPNPKPETQFVSKNQIIVSQCYKRMTTKIIFDDEDGIVKHPKETDQKHIVNY